MLKIQELTFTYNKDPFIENLNISFQKGQITSIIGANGSGKSTLLMLMSKGLSAGGGSIYVDGRDLTSYSLKEYAQKVAVVHQKNTIEYDMDVETIVSFGRLPYLNYYQHLTKDDHEIIKWAMEVTDLSDLGKHSLKTLSGGQQQRVWIAMALAQKTPILLLDEPTTYLDIKYQLEILNLIRKINEDLHMSIIMVHHDINQAIHYSHTIVAMKHGKIAFNGIPDEVITKTSLKALYDCEFQIIKHDDRTIVLNVQ